MKLYGLPQINKEVETVVLANGKFPTHPIPLSILKRAKYIISCDGATNTLTEQNIVPDAIVGDCDSLSDENRIRFTDRIVQVNNQEINDLTKAINFCVEKGLKKIIILGATGKREDHTIGNISLLCEYMSLADVEMITDHGVFVAIDSTTSFESYPRQQVSLFSIDRSPITATNLVYPIENQIFTNWWQATLNEASGNSFTIATEGRTIVYRLF